MINTSVLNLKNERQKAILLLIVTATMWSMGGLVIKLVNASPMSIAGVRAAFGAAVMLIALGKPKINWSKAQVYGALAYAATGILYVIATKTTTAANAILLQYISPVYAAFFGAWLLKEKAKASDWAAIIIVLGGMAVFLFDNLNMKGTLGIIAAIASGVTFALFTVFMRMQKDGSPLETVLLGNVFIAIIGLPFLIQSAPKATEWPLLVILGVVQLGLPYLMYSYAIKHITAVESILITVIEPILNPLWVFLMIGEKPGPLSLLGGFIVLVVITIKCIHSSLPVERQAIKGTDINANG